MIIGKRADLTGHVFERLTVLEYSHTKRYETSNQAVLYWRCACSCGNYHTTSGASLKRGSVKSCGCLRKEQVAKNRLIKRNNLGLSRTPKYRLWNAAKERAKKREWNFDIDPWDCEIPETCPVLSIPLVKGKGKQHAGSPTLDRVDSSKGYIKGNVRVISQRANSLKQDASIEQLELLISYMKGER